jgi:hypothetical protein
MGIPTVALVTAPFVKAAQNIAEGIEGMAVRNVVVEHPFTQTGAAATEKAEGIIDGIIASLLAPPVEGKRKTGIKVTKKIPRIAVRGSLNEIQDKFQKECWTDGLPIIPPTEEGLEEMLTGTSHKPDEVIGLMPLQLWPATVEKVAINGIMAGCKPCHLPVLLAGIEAYTKEKDFLSSLASASSFAFVHVVNGPIAKEIGMNSGNNALGPGNVSNASIGRAFRLCAINLGGVTPGINDMSSQGNPAKYGVAFAENEAASPPGWQPYHVEMAHAPEESVITIFQTWGYKSCPVRLGTPGELKVLVKEIESLWAADELGILMLVDPLPAGVLATLGMTTKTELREWLFKEAHQTIEYWKGTPVWQYRVQPEILAGLWPREYLDLPPDATIPMFSSSKQIRIVVLGGGTGNGITTWSTSYSPSSASIDKWR